MRKKFDELNINNPFYYERGHFNNITDVDGIKVGHSTIYEGDDIRTGVTCIMPEMIFDNDLNCGGYAFNANGEMTGLQYVLEEGKLYCPIFLTNTISLGDVCSILVSYYKNRLALPIVGECWDGWLNDIWGKHVKDKHVIESIESAESGIIKQGCVGAGTGMTSFGFKSGIGTSSRKVKILDEEYTVGVIVNNNMSRDDGSHRYLRIGGVDYSKEIREYEHELMNNTGTRQNNSSILVIATDAPLDSRQLTRLSKHAPLGFARTGLVSYTGSGDFVLAFSTGNKLPKRDSKVMYTNKHIEESLLDDIFEATLEAVEESYLNSMLCAVDMTGKDGHFSKAISTEEIEKIIKNRIK